jgi:hypothetical protein
MDVGDQDRSPAGWLYSELNAAAVGQLLKRRTSRGLPAFLI